MAAPAAARSCSRAGARRSPTRPGDPESVAAAPEPPTASRDTPAAKSSSPRPPLGGSASPRPASPGDNAVYRIDPDGVAREVFRARVLIYALAWHGDRLLVGTGPEGQLYEVREHGRESAPLARLDNGQILALLPEPQGGLLLGAGDPASVVRLTPGFVASGTFVSDVHDTKLISRFGSLNWRAERPAGTSVALQVRTGNVGEPDETWSAWSAEQTAPDALQGDRSARTVRPVPRHAGHEERRRDSRTALRFPSATRPRTFRPRSPGSTCPMSARVTGRPARPGSTLRWDVTDPNDDELSYTLHVRKDGWPDWVRLDEDPLTEKTYSWDTTAVPAGLYRLRVTASDRPSNNPDDALTRDRESEPFLVDHEAPAVSVTAQSRGATVTLKDNLTRLVKAAYALDGGEWTPDVPRRRPLRHPARDDHDQLCPISSRGPTSWSFAPRTRPGTSGPGMP